MKLDLSFVVLLTGYLFLVRCNWTRFVARRRSGYHLLFGSGIAGVVLLAISYVAVKKLPWPWANEMWIALTPQHLHDPVNRSIGLSLLLSVVIASLINRILVSDRYGLVRAINRERNGLEMLLAEALKNAAPVEIVLKGDVFYVGRVAGIDPPSDRASYVEFSPLLQGFMNPQGTLQSPRKYRTPQKMMIPFGDIRRARDLTPP